MSTESTGNSSTTVGARPGATGPTRPTPTRPGQARPVQGQPRTQQPTGAAQANGRPAQAPPNAGGRAQVRPAEAPRGAVRAGVRPAGVLKGPRKARLTLSQVNPWSVLKLSFLLAVAVGIISVVMTGVVWNVVNGMGVFTEINTLVRQVEGAQSTFDIYRFVGFERIVSAATVIAVANVLVLTALSTLFAFLYNIGSGLVGGLRVTLTDE